MPNAVLTDEQVILIRKEWDDRNINVREMANIFNVTPETIRRIGRRDTYRHVGKPGFQSSDHRISGPKQVEIPAAEIDASLMRLMQQLDEPDKVGNAFE